MNEKLVQKVHRQDPRERRHLAPPEIKRLWWERRLGGLLFKWTALIALGVFVRWYVTRDPYYTLARSLPKVARWSLGLAILAVFGFSLYGAFAYRCPQCERFYSFDWSLGGFLWGRKEEKYTCRYCRANLT